MLDTGYGISLRQRKVVVLQADDVSQTQLRAWATKQGFDLGTDYDGNRRDPALFDFHATLVASQNAVAHPDPTQFPLVTPVTCEVLGLDELGKDRRVPVLRIEPHSRLVSMRKFFIESCGLIPTFAEFKPHVSLSYAWAGVPALRAIAIPRMTVTFDALKIANLT